MKNFPHQFNDLTKLFGSLRVAKELTDAGTPLSDENYGTALTRAEIYTYRDRTLTIDQYLANERTKPAESRGYLTVARDTRRFLELLNFIIILNDNKDSRITSTGKQLLATETEDKKVELWKNAFLNLKLEGTDGEISHPYKILLKIVSTKQGIDTPKLMLALEAENDSDEEFERIIALSDSTVEDIIRQTGTSPSMAANAVKILPGVAEQLLDIERINNQAYLANQTFVTEDEIIPEEESDTPTRTRATYRLTSSVDIAKEPNVRMISSSNVDMTEAIRIRQNRLSEHQEIVRKLGELNELSDFEIYDGKFDCLGTKEDSAILYEVKTILTNNKDQEKQTVKGVGQLKYYAYSIVKKEMDYDEIKEVIVFSKKPDSQFIEFCNNESIEVVWKVDDSFFYYNQTTDSDDEFFPDNLL
jgi:hypothetical protein